MEVAMPKSRTHRPRWRGGALGADYECLYCGELFTELEDAVREFCPESPAPWSHWRINERFLSNLWTLYGSRDAGAPAREFTNQDAYELYAEQHAQRVSPLRGPRVDDVWLQMNVRNTLCKAAYEGRLIRIAPGRYKFPA
jgi:hypothetical protein